MEKKSIRVDGNFMRQAAEAERITQAILQKHPDVVLLQDEGMVLEGKIFLSNDSITIKG